MSVGRTLIKLREYQTNNAETLTYASESIMAANVKQALDWILAVLYPNTKDNVDTPADLPLTMNALNDYRVVLDDGDGKAAGYRWCQYEGESSPSWHKIHDMDWSTDSILTALYNQTQELYVYRLGRMDYDETGTPLTGLLEGQSIYGGVDSGNLTLNANRGSHTPLPEDQTGYIQFYGHSRPTHDEVFDSGTATERFRDVFLARHLTDGTIELTLANLKAAYDHISINSGNPHNVTYDELTSRIGTITIDGDVSGTLDLSTAGDKTLTLEVADDSHYHSSLTITDFEEAVYDKVKAVLQDVTGFTWTQDDVLETLTPDINISTSDIDDVADPEINKILVGNTLGDNWIASDGLIELTGEVSGSATYDSTTDKWSIDTLVESVPMENIDGFIYDNKPIITSTPGITTILEITAHGLVDGELIRIFNTDIDGAHAVSVIDADHVMISVDTSAPIVGGYYIPQGAQLLYDPASNTFGVKKEYEEIRLGELDGLDEDVLSQYVRVEGRSGGQTIQGGISAGEALVLESTSSATKGSVESKDNLTPYADATFSAVWTGKDLGSASKRWKDIHMAGQAIGLRTEAVASIPVSAANRRGRLYNMPNRFLWDTGASIQELLPVPAMTGKAGQALVVDPTESFMELKQLADDVITQDAFTPSTTQAASVTAMQDYVASQTPTLEDENITVTANGLNKTLKQAIIDQDLGGGGEINYITNKNLDSSLAGYDVYQDAAGVAPVDGTGGTPTVYLQQATTALRGTNSLELVKPAGNCQGQGFSTDFPIDLADQTRILKVAFDYNSGSALDGDIRLFFKDLTNNTAPQELVHRDLMASSRGNYVSYFQVPHGCTSGRLIAHIATTNASAYSVTFDNFSVGPYSQVRGSITTDWKEYTPVITEGGTNRTSEFSTNWARWRRVGDEIEINWRGVRNGNTSVGGGGAFLVSLPSGLTIDSTKGPIDSLGVYFVSNDTSYQGTIQANGSSLWVIQNYASVQRNYNNTNFPAGSNHAIQAKAPILGWSSNMVLSEDAGNREISFKGFKSVNQTGLAANSDTVMTFSPTIDKANGWSAANNWYVVQESGTHEIYGKTTMSKVSGNFAGEYIRLRILINGSLIEETYGYQASGTDAQMQIFTIMDLKKGDTVAVTSGSNATYNIIAANTHLAPLLIIAKRSSPQTIGMGETVSAKVRSSNNQTISQTPGTPTILTWNANKDYDTHGMVITSSGQFIIQVSGYYALNCKLMTNAIAWVAGDNAELYYSVQGLYISTIDYLFIESALNQSKSLNGYDEVYLKKGDVLTFGLVTSKTVTLYPAATQNFATVTRLNK